MFVAPAGNLRVVEPENVLAAHQQFAGSGVIDGRDHVQQRRLAGARWAHERQKLAGCNVNRNVVKRPYFEGLALENLADMPRLNNFSSRGNVGCDNCAHACPLILILSPSFKVGGALVITFSPPTSPSTNAPSLR